MFFLCTIIISRALQAATGRRGLIFTRSSFVGSGILGGHWTGDNYAYWDHMQYSVIGNFLQSKGLT
jgi:maltase-glucoamylase